MDMVYLHTSLILLKEKSQEISHFKQVCVLYEELLNQPRSLLKRSQRHVAQSHDLAKKNHRIHEEEQDISYMLELIYLTNLDDK
jgi:hypothetical protein